MQSFLIHANLKKNMKSDDGQKIKTTTNSQPN